MRIHHTQHQKAQKMGVQLEELGQFIRAIWPMRNMAIFATDGRYAIEQMEFAQRLVKWGEDHDIELSLQPSLSQPTMAHLVINGELTPATNTPAIWWNQKESLLIDKEPLPAQQQVEEATQFVPANESTRGDWEHTGKREVQPSFVDTIRGVPTNGARAFHKGFMAASCPFMEDDPQFDVWNTQFDEAADAQTSDHAHETPESEEEKPPASVVKVKYRAIYAELGHPTTCGDELANKLDNLVKNAKGTNMEYFDAIMKANEIDMAKYSKTTNGWQGRYRMTGRNMLAKRVHANGGVLHLPDGTELRMSADWMSSQRFQK